MNELRKCIVEIGKVQKPGVFHKWYDFAATVPASPFVGGAPAGQVSRTYAIVETEDGKIICCEPGKVTFVKNVHPSGGCDYCRRHNVRRVMPLGNSDGLGVVKARFCFNCGRDLSKEADT